MHTSADQLRAQVSSGTMTLNDITQTANTHLADNRLEEALVCISVLADACPQDADTAVTAGLVALTLKRRPEAIEYFEKALKSHPEHYNASYNLALAYLEDGRQEEAARILTRLTENHPQDASLLNDLAVVYIELENVSNALICWKKALRVDPNLSLARNNAMASLLARQMYTEAKSLLDRNSAQKGLTAKTLAEIAAWRGKLPEQSETNASPAEASRDDSMATVTSPKAHKIAIFASIDSFMADINAHLSGTNEVKSFKGQTIDEMQKMLRWADLAWFEWCDQLLIEATKFPKTCPIICRLHSYEAFTDMPSKVDWSKVDLLIFVNRSVKELFERQVKSPVSSIVIHNAVDVSKFVIPTSKKYGRKIASVGYINYKKNPALLLYCFKKIHEYDPGYSLHIAGEHQDPRIQVYFEHFLRENPLPVYFDGWVKDMPTWYADKDFVISTSLFESFHYSIAEGMACGLMPLIHNWYGASNLYPGEYLFNDPDGCLELLLRLEREDRMTLAMKNREYIEDRYSLSDKLQEIDKALNSVLARADRNSRVEVKA